MSAPGDGPEAMGGFATLDALTTSLGLGIVGGPENASGGPHGHGPTDDGIEDAMYMDLASEVGQPGQLSGTAQMVAQAFVAVNHAHELRSLGERDLRYEEQAAVAINNAVNATRENVVSTFKPDANPGFKYLKKPGSEVRAAMALHVKAMQIRDEYLGKPKSGMLAEFLWNLTAFHYEIRDLKNNPKPTYVEVTRPNSGWVKLPASQNVYHDNERGKAEIKFVHPSGREVVFDGDTLERINDPKYRGTYNYVNPMSDDIERDTLAVFLEYWTRNIDHVIFDIVPYKLGDNDRDED